MYIYIYYICIYLLLHWMTFSIYVYIFKYLSIPYVIIQSSLSSLYVIDKHQQPDLAAKEMKEQMKQLKDLWGFEEFTEVCLQ